jgi:hypothetical protein
VEEKEGQRVGKEDKGEGKEEERGKKEGGHLGEYPSISWPRSMFSLSARLGRVGMSDNQYC